MRIFLIVQVSARAKSLGSFTDDAKIDISEFSNPSIENFIIVPESARRSFTVMNHSALTDQPRDLVYVYNAAKAKIDGHYLEITAPTTHGAIIWFNQTSKIPYTVYYLA